MEKRSLFFLNFIYVWTFCTPRIIDVGYRENTPCHCLGSHNHHHQHTTNKIFYIIYFILGASCEESILLKLYSGSAIHTHIMPHIHIMYVYSVLFVVHIYGNNIIVPTKNPWFDFHIIFCGLFCTTFYALLWYCSAGPKHFK